MYYFSGKKAILKPEELRQCFFLHDFLLYKQLKDKLYYYCVTNGEDTNSIDSMGK